ncbi:L-threonine dehydratase catabolic TdcB-like isoform X2 [Monodelphis domestica]|uniref:L-threonine dehydratase catabolic TdcB-like isoform X2 n=1 Tax=Monodelphis domestica TaxID=13616 RepID=UPI0024E264FC|nr:L-threonine dehydratase catabolic TdcB-like isoform X2 [Monodelphis domestica]
MCWRSAGSLGGFSKGQGLVLSGEDRKAFRTMNFVARLLYLKEPLDRTSGAPFGGEEDYDLFWPRNNDKEKKPEAATHQDTYGKEQEPLENSSLGRCQPPNQLEQLKDYGEENGLQGSSKTWEIKVREHRVELLNDSPSPVGPSKGRTHRQPSSSKLIRLEDINRAAIQIQRGVQITPCTYSRLSKKYGMELYMKKEYLQYTGSVKDRGVLCLLASLHQDQQRKGVIVASDSNFSMAVAYHASELQIPAFVIMPTNTSVARVRMCRDYGAVVITFGGSAKDSQNHAQQLAQKNEYLYLEEEDSFQYLSGLGTMGLEIFRQVPNLDAVVFPAGGLCGLLAGSAAALKQLNPQISVIGVQPESFPVLQHSLRMGQPIDGGSHMFYRDLSEPCSGKNTLQLVGQLVDKIVSVTEEDILIAMLRLLEYERATVDAEGAIGLAAIVAGKLPEFKGKRVAVALCSGNLSLNLLQQCIQRALTLDSRICKFSLWMGDGTGDISKLLEILDREAVRVLDIQKEHGFVTSKLFTTKVTCVAETRDKQQATQLRSALLERYPTLEWLLQ